MYRGKDVDDDNDNDDNNHDLEICFFTASRYTLSEFTKKKPFSKGSCLNFITIFCKQLYSIYCDPSEFEVYFC